VRTRSISFDFPGGEPAPDFAALVAPDGSERRVADDLAFPSGMAITEMARATPPWGTVPSPRAAAGEP
jgi:hypothetical protein